MKPKPYTYGDSLLKAVEILACPVNRPPVIASGINGGELLKRRVKMIISKKLIGSDLRWLKTAIIIGALIVLPLGLINAQNDKKISLHKAASDLSHEEILEMKEKEILQAEYFLNQELKKIEKAILAGDIPEEDGKAKLEELSKRLAALKSKDPNTIQVAGFWKPDYVPILRSAVADGMITVDYIEEKMAEYEEMQYEEMQQKLAEAVEAGRITQEEADAKSDAHWKWIENSREKRDFSWLQ
jgi:hypothetical protein